MNQVERLKNKTDQFTLELDSFRFTQPFAQAAVEVVASAVITIRNIEGVDFPEPEDPMMETNAPLATSISFPFSTRSGLPPTV